MEDGRELSERKRKVRHPFSLHFTKHGSTSPRRQRLVGWRAPCERSSCTYLERTQPTVAAGGKLPESCIETRRERRLQKREKSSHFHSQCPKKSCPSWPSVKNGSPSTTRWIHTGHGSFLCHRGMENLGQSQRKPVKQFHMPMRSPVGKKI